MSEQIHLDQLVLVNGATGHPHAFRRLEAELPGDVVALGDAPPTGVTAIRLRTADDLPEGGFRIRVTGGDQPLVDVEGGPFSGVIYGTNALIDRLRANDWTVEPGEWTEAPALPYRTWWNWDHTTNWDVVQIGAQEIGVMNPYAKPPEGFLADYKRVVDFMSLNRIAAVTIFGFLRDSHGGIEAGQELCRYANERGVRILPGIAINAYGGVVWEMDHKYNLGTWLRQHPELEAKMERPAGFQLKDLAFPLYFPAADYAVRGCSSRPENQAWMDEAVTWLSETFDIGGVNIEAGDYGVCGCELCAARRAEREDASRRLGYAESWSHADMADYFPRLMDIIKQRHPDAWVYSEIQWDNLLDFEAQRPLEGLPDGGIYQHTVNRSYWYKVRDEATRAYADTLPTRTNVLRSQFNCQWNGDFRTERYRFNGKDFAEEAKKVAEIGFKGLTVWGEVSPYVVPTELSYLAYARFTWNPDLTWGAFMAEEVAPRVGGEAAAERYVEMLEILDAVPFHDDALLNRIRSESLSHAAATSGDVSRRWLWLAESAQRRSFNQANKPESSPW